MDAASSPGDPASGPDPGPSWEVEPATPKATRNRLVPGAGILAFADGLAANMPMMLRLVREFEEAGEQLPRSVTDVVATFRDCSVVLEEWPRHEGLGQVQDNLMSSGEDAGTPITIVFSSHRKTGLSLFCYLLFFCMYL